MPKHGIKMPLADVRLIRKNTRHSVESDKQKSNKKMQSKTRDSADAT
jgi:hypothetical protein